MKKTNKTKNIDMTKVKTITVTAEGIEKYVFEALQKNGAVEKIVSEFPSRKADYWIKWNEREGTTVLEFVFSEK